MIVGTRGGEIALRQAQLVRKALVERADIEASLRVSRTADDVLTDAALDGSEGESFSREELESVLLTGEVDVIVLPADQLPPHLPEGLTLGAIPHRGERRDFVIIRRATWEERAPLGLKARARLGFSSSRQQAQLRELRPDVQLHQSSGDISSRLRRLSEGHLDAIAIPGFAFELLELGGDDFVICKLPPDLMVPAPGQGAVLVECREEDVETVNACALIHDPHIAAEVEVERHLMARVMGAPGGTLGAYCECDDQSLHLWVFLGQEDSGNSENLRGDFVATSAEQVVSAACEFLAGNGSAEVPLAV